MSFLWPPCDHTLNDLLVAAPFMASLWLHPLMTSLCSHPLQTFMCSHLLLTLLYLCAAGTESGALLLPNNPLANPLMSHLPFSETMGACHAYELT
eukprot:1137008-Pelagomonas_calceolata.AAC.2